MPKDPEANKAADSSNCTFATSVHDNLKRKRRRKKNKCNKSHWETEVLTLFWHESKINHVM